MALLARRPSAVPGAYAEVGPVFIHAQPCPGPAGTGYPEGFRHRQQLLRAYDGQGRAVDNGIVDGAAAEGALQALLARPDVIDVHSRNWSSRTALTFVGCVRGREQRCTGVTGSGRRAPRRPPTSSGKGDDQARSPSRGAATSNPGTAPCTVAVTFTCNHGLSEPNPAAVDADSR